MTIQQIAELAHEANGAYCRLLGEGQPSWTTAPLWQVTSAVNGVKFHIENPGASPSRAHESWLRQKQEEGWTYGAVKDHSKKEHPCFLPYDELPPEQQMKDTLFIAIVNCFRHMVT